MPTSRIVQDTLFEESGVQPLDLHNRHIFNPSLDLDRVPSGWYSDPSDSQWLRYWNGNHWTDQRKPCKSIN